MDIKRHMPDNAGPGSGPGGPRMDVKFPEWDMDDWLGTPPETPKHFDEELTADIVVLGAGLAGLAAARTAAESGASVLVLEKSQTLGGRSRDFTAFGSKEFEAHFPICKQWHGRKWEIVQAVMKGCLSRPKEAILAKWADMNGETLDWFVDAVPKEELFYGSDACNEKPENAKYAVLARNYPYPKYYNPDEEYYPCWPGTAWLQPNGLAFMQANLKKTQELAGERFTIRFRTAAKKLLTENGRVTGAVAEDGEGHLIKAVAKKGVILTTGGFLSNDSMVKHLLPKVYANGYRADGSGGDRNMYIPRVDGLPTNTGDGHKMAVWIGAMMQQDGCAMAHHKGGVVGTSPFLLLDKTGHRFMNEDTQGGPLGQRIEELPGMCAYQFFDSHVIEQLDYMPYGHGKITNLTQEELDRSVERGQTMRGDTLEALMQQLDINEENAIASIHRYNELSRKGCDDDFGKTAKRMFPIEAGPFYCAVWHKGDTLVTLSGLESDENAHVYDQNYNIIPGLYVAGNTQGNRFAGDYPEVVLGLSHGLALVYGRVAAQNAIKGI